MDLNHLAKKILSPLELQVKAKRNKKSLAQLGLLSVTWPISAPFAMVYALTRKDEGYPNPRDEVIVAGLVGAPYLFFQELFDPEHKYFKIGARDALEEANDVNPRIRFYENDQKQDGPNTCRGLEIIYSDGVYLQIFPDETHGEKLDLDLDKLVDYVDECGRKWSKLNPRGTRLCVDPDFNPQVDFLSRVYRDAPFSLKTDFELKKELDAILVKT